MMIEILLWAVAIGLPFGALLAFGSERAHINRLIAAARPGFRTAVKLRDEFVYVVPEVEYNEMQAALRRDQRRTTQRRDAKGRFKRT